MDPAHVYFVFALERGVTDNQHRRATERRDRLVDDTGGLYAWLIGRLHGRTRRPSAALGVRPRTVR